MDDQIGAAFGVLIVELVADFALATEGACEQGLGPRGLTRGRLDQSFAMEQDVEFAKLVGVAEGLQREMLIGPLGRVAFVEPEAHHV